MATELAWHFAPDNGRTRHSNEPIVEGEWLEVEGKLRMCSWGLHASKKLIDALKFAPGALCCRVELQGDIVYGDDKLVARRRRVLQMVDATDLLHEFACRCAEDALELLDSPDPRSLKAIETKRRWLRGEATDDELGEARLAASAALWAASAASASAWWAAASLARAASGDQNRRLTAMVSHAMRQQRQGVDQ